MCRAVVRTLSTFAGESVNEREHPHPPTGRVWEMPCLQEEVGKEAPGGGPGGDARQHLGDRSELGAGVMWESAPCE